MTTARHYLLTAFLWLILFGLCWCDDGNNGGGDSSIGSDSLVGSNHNKKDKHNNHIMAAATAASIKKLLDLISPSLSHRTPVDRNVFYDDLKLILKDLLSSLDNDDNAVLETLLAQSRDDFQRVQKIQQHQHQHQDEVDEDDDECVDESYYADRHLVNILNTYNNYDCLEREFDVSAAASSSFDVDTVAQVFQQCHLVVLRNVFAKQDIQDLKSNFSNYIGKVYTGQIRASRQSGGATTHGGDSFVLHEGNKRWNILPPRNLVQPSIFANPVLLDILSAPSILGGGSGGGDGSGQDDHLIVNHIGNINAEKGAQAQGWHSDGTYIHGEDSLQVSGVAGHDLAPYAINMFTPFLDMTSHNLGPTEFCLGTSNLRGLGADESLLYNILDETLFENGIAERLYNFDQERVGTCPAGFYRAPLLNMGDVVLVDYMVTHRGGANLSDRLRSLLFITYSRKWYHDSNFDISYGDSDEDQEDNNWLTKFTRFALVEYVKEQQNSCPSDEACKDNEKTPPLESISNFLQAYDGWDDDEVAQNYHQDVTAK